MTVCAREGCGNEVIRNQRGRPALYCSATCRQRTTTERHRIRVEVDHPAVGAAGRPAGRTWLVRLRRGGRTVVIADDLGWASANALAGDLEALLFPRRQRKKEVLD